MDNIEKANKAFLIVISILGSLLVISLVNLFILGSNEIISIITIVGVLLAGVVFNIYLFWWLRR